MSTFYHRVTCLQPPFSMGKDDNGRPLYGFNLQIEKELSASALWIDDLATYAQTNSIGTIGTNLYRFKFPAGAPDAAVALIPYGGLEAEQAYGSDAIKWEFPRVQVVCRAAKDDDRAAYQKAEDAYRVFGKVTAESL